MHPVSCINTHHDIKDLVNHEMVENTKTRISWEWSITFLRNKKVLNLCLRWYIFRSYCYVAEVNFKFWFYIGVESANEENISAFESYWKAVKNVLGMSLTLFNFRQSTRYFERMFAHSSFELVGFGCCWHISNSCYPEKVFEVRTGWGETHYQKAQSRKWHRWWIDFSNNHYWLVRFFSFFGPSNKNYSGKDELLQS